MNMRDTFKCYFKSRGFTLLEVITTIVIMTMAMIPVMHLVPLILQTRAKVEIRTNCLFLAQGKMEEVKDAVLSYYDKDGGYSEGATSFPAPYSEYVYQVSDNSDPWLRTVRVRVWHSDTPQYIVTLDSETAKRPKGN